MDKDILTSCMTENEGGVYLDIKVTPDSPVDRIKGVNRWRNNVEFAVKESAKGGRANRSVVAFLSDILSRPESDINIVHGKKSRQKRIFISGMDMDKLLSYISKNTRDDL